METIEQLRQSIQKIDASIIEKLAERQGLAKQIGLLKAQTGKEVVDLSQEKNLFEFYKGLCEKYNLQFPFIRRLFRIIIDYSRQVQKT